jgi:hypothetical protein
MTENEELENAMSKLTFENEVIDPVEIIENSENFKYLDQIIHFKGFIFIIDWGTEPCIHVLNNKFEYIKKLTKTLYNGNCQYFHSMAKIQIFDSEYLGILSNKEITFISVTDKEINWLEKKILFEDPMIVNHQMISDLKSKLMLKRKKSELRCYGLNQDNDTNDETIYFIETCSEPKCMITYLKNRFSVIRITLPTFSNLPCFRDLKIKGQFLFLNDYQILNKNDTNIYMGNNCIHIFSKQIEYITSIGLNNLNGPYYLNFIKDELFVCERKKNGCIKVFKSEPGLNDYRLINEFNINCEFPSFFFKFDNHFFVTQVYGNQFNYNGSSKIFKFKI